MKVKYTFNSKKLRPWGPRRDFPVNTVVIGDKKKAWLIVPGPGRQPSWGKRQLDLAIRILGSAPKGETVMVVVNKQSDYNVVRKLVRLVHGDPRVVRKLKREELLRKKQQKKRQQRKKRYGTPTSAIYFVLSKTGRGYTGDFYTRADDSFIETFPAKPLTRRACLKACEGYAGFMTTFSGKAS
jgi:hypothetical protein